MDFEAAGHTHLNTSTNSETYVTSSQTHSGHLWDASRLCTKFGAKGMGGGGDIADDVDVMGT
ncbi:hypothetical protein BD410DRAFT_796731 [Rickenella mellea]|uniref:Uncharacterized protein n=1 Tax=Rickenella mellea TaxID=50990 RepID=A0A4Y7PHX7_9AGAM|nr:hypothetical protein BD410DRAFT_796731 [Rickenella mellea]